MPTTPDLPPPDIGPWPKRDSSTSRVSLRRFRKAFMANCNCSLEGGWGDGCGDAIASGSDIRIIVSPGSFHRDGMWPYLK